MDVKVLFDLKATFCCIIICKVTSIYNTFPGLLTQTGCNRPPPVLDTREVAFLCEGLKQHYLNSFGRGLNP